MFDGVDLVRLGVVAQCSRYCHAHGTLRVDKVSVTAFAASIDEAGGVELGDEVEPWEARAHRTTRPDGLRMSKDGYVDEAVYPVRRKMSYRSARKSRFGFRLR